MEAQTIIEDLSVSDFVFHGLVVIVGVCLLACLAPLWVPLYIVGRFAHLHGWPIEESDLSMVDGYW